MIEARWHKWKAWYPVWSQEDGKMIWAWPIWRKAVEWQCSEVFEEIGSWDVAAWDEHMVCTVPLVHYRLAREGQAQ